MARDLRYFLPNTLVEVTNVTFQNRSFLRPSEELNDIFLGVLGLAQKRHAMPLCGVVVLSTHFHLLTIPRDPEHLADFMEYLNTNLSKEIGRLHGWKGHLWHDRYHHVPVSNEETMQIHRLRYLLAAGVKEFLVDRVAQWPGVHSAAALTKGEALAGHWYSRSKEYGDRQRGKKNVDPRKHASAQRVSLSPLPCWKHLPEKIWRRHVEELVAEIDAEGAKKRRRTGRCSLGVERIMGRKPTRRPRKVKKSPRPRYHATAAREFQRWREALGMVIKEFYDASGLWRSGDRSVTFPEGTFPPAPPFVPFAETLLARNSSLQARGQPG